MSNDTTEPAQLRRYPAAFINAIHDEGTKDEAVEWLQKTWNDYCHERSLREAAAAEALLVRTALEAELTALREQLSVQTGMREKMGDECGRMMGELAAKDARIATLQAEVAKLTQAHMHCVGTIDGLEVDVAERDARIAELTQMNTEKLREIVTLADSVRALTRDLAAARVNERRYLWLPADEAPAGHSGIVRQELAEGTWRYLFAERRVCRGFEGWFDNEGGALLGVTYWMPIPEDPAHLASIAARNAAIDAALASPTKGGE